MEFPNCEEIGSSSSSSSCSLCLCRICHEEEEQSSTSMESPCACSGTLKFAHRRCVQRWCDEKQSTICEICLEKFEPGYTVTVPSPLPAQVIEVIITIRGSLEAARHDNELLNPAMAAVAGSRREQEHADRSPASNRVNSCFQSVASLFAFLFLLRHTVAVILLGNDHLLGSDHYSFSLSLAFLLRAAAFLLPLCLILQLITKIINAGRRQQQQIQERDGEGEEDIEEL